ncbi:MAG: YibE/F family protein [Limosilactobacillus sp.]|uniref:YibE/F family protein n=1 Tax=Limosilactobacillus sp. TaxID=2773925 RepID=UPI0026FCD3E1|nr:YibE/F family protein [Limosilactobacillus sp.]
MSTITALGLVLLLLMVLVGGKQGWSAFVSLLLNFGFLYFAIVLIAFHVPPLFVTAVTGVVILAITIFMGEDDLRTTVTAFYASLIVTAVLVALIFFIEHWAMVQGFGTEDSDDLEGMSILIGISYFKVLITATTLSTLGAIAEASMAVSAGLTEILTKHPDVENRQLMTSGMSIGHQIIGTTLNTLFFGFFGGFLALFIWFAGLHYSLGTIMNNKIFVSEMIDIMISFVGVLLAVPTTAWMMTKRRNKVISTKE